MQTQELMALAGTYEAARAVQVAVKIGVFEALAQGPQQASGVAKKIRASLRGTEILLDVMAALELVRKTKGRYSLSALARQHLLQASPQSYATMITFMEQGFVGFTELEQAVRTGRPLNPPDMFQDDTKSLEKFIGAMHDLAVVRGDARILARKLRLKRYRRLIDIGGGPGTFSIEFCRANPKLEATVYDLPETSKIARRMLRKNDPTGRVSVSVGDYNKGPLPSGFDVAFLSNIIHSETERGNLRLVKKCYRALNSGGQIIIKDHLLNDALTAPRDGAVFALTMLLFTRGRSYAETEVAGWLKQAGFKRVRRVKTPKPMTSDLMIGEK